MSGTYRFVEIEGAGHFLTDDLGATTVRDELLAFLTIFESEAAS